VAAHPSSALVLAPRPAAVQPSVTPAPRALTTRFLDFWLLGGASLVVWAAMVLASQFRGSVAVGTHFGDLASTSASLALVVNYPHFMSSYAMAYTRGRPFILRYWWQLLVVPVLLLALLAAAYAFYDVPATRLSLVQSAADAIATWGVNGQVLAGPLVGDLLLTAAFNLMLLTIGWHYTKQVFGCMMVYARFDGYAMSAADRQLTRWTLMSVWAMSFVDANISGSFRAWGGFSYSTLDLPDPARPLAIGIVLLGFVLVAYRVFYANYRRTGRRPSLNMVVPFVALYVWWLPGTRQAEFYFLLVPFFHSLQYLAFVYKREGTRIMKRPHPELRAFAVVVAIVAAGWLAFEFLPGTLDRQLNTFDTRGVFFFLTAAMLFINIHHYFIDNVLWRFADPDVRQYLLGER
jgi:hypothetical protein